MQIRVLGSVEVLVDGHVRPLPAAGERELLALLALAAGRVVPVPALIDALWGDRRRPGADPFACRPPNVPAHGHRAVRAVGIPGGAFE